MRQRTSTRAAASEGRVSATRPWVCRLHPVRGSSLYVRVMVWPTKRAMLDYLNEHHHTIHGNGFGTRTQAACGGYEGYHYRTDRNARRRSPCVAEVSFWRGKLGIGVIAHEFFHATMRWGHRRGWDFSALDTGGCSMMEERFAYVHGNLCREFMVQGLRPGGVYSDADTAKGG